MGKLQRWGRLPAGRGGELSNAGDTHVGVVGRRRDLCECQRSSAGSLLSQVVVGGVAARMRRRRAKKRGEATIGVADLS